VEQESTEKRTLVKDAINDFFREKGLFVGKDGMGSSRKAIKAYTYRLGKLQEFCNAGIEVPAALSKNQ
jgi:hypothetical protein